MTTSKTVKESSKKVTLLSRIMAKLGLDDQGQVDKFLKSLKKECDQKIKVIESNLKVLKVEYEIALEQLEGQLEDLITEYDASFCDVDVEKLKSNVSMESYREGYWYNIESAQARVKRVEEQIKNLKDDYKENVASNKEQIDSFKTRIEKLS